MLKVWDVKMKGSQLKSKRMTFLFFSFFQKKKLLPLVKTMYIGENTTHMLQANLHGYKETNMYKGINKDSNSSDEHNITRLNPLNMSLTQPTFSIDILQSIVHSHERSKWPIHGNLG